MGLLPSFGLMAALYAVLIGPCYLLIRRSGIGK
jgi:hypothetical protein